MSILELKLKLSQTHSFLQLASLNACELLWCDEDEDEIEHEDENENESKEEEAKTTKDEDDTDEQEIDGERETKHAYGYGAISCRLGFRFLSAPYASRGAALLPILHVVVTVATFVRNKH